MLNELIREVSEKAVLSIPDVSHLNDIKGGQDPKSGSMKLDIYLNVRYGKNIPAVSWDVQNAVSDAILKSTDLKVKTIDIHIEGVDPGKGR